MLLVLLWSVVAGVVGALTLEHSVDGGLSYSGRSEIVITPTLSRNKMIRIEPSYEFTRDERDSLSQQEFYFLRAGKAITSIPVCSMSSYEHIEVQLDSSAHLLSVAVRPAKGFSGGECAEIPEKLSTSIQASLDVIAQIIPVQVTGVRPPQSYVEARKAADKDITPEERKAAQENRSFFAKYWHIIIPVVLLFLTTSSEQPDAAGEKKPAASSS